MNFSESLHTLRKRWIMTLVIFALVVVAIGGAAVKLPRSYQSTATVALLASNSDSKLYYDSNPYLAFDDSLNVAADVLGRRMMDPRIVTALAAEGYNGTYSIVDAPNSPGPVLIITATDKVSAIAQSTLQGVTNAMATQLSSLQSDVAPQNRITDTVLSTSVKPSLTLSKMVRPLAAVVVVGFVLVFSIPLIVEGISVRRRAKKKVKTPHAPESIDQPEDDVVAPSAEASTASSSSLGAS